MKLNQNQVECHEYQSYNNINIDQRWMTHRARENKTEKFSIKIALSLSLLHALAETNGKEKVASSSSERKATTA